MNTRQRLAALKTQQDIELRRSAEIARLEAELANRPKEPELDTVVAFEHSFKEGGTVYNYTAYHAIQGWWYLTSNGYCNKKNWDELLDFVDGADIWVAKVWEKL